MAESSSALVSIVRRRWPLLAPFGIRVRLPPEGLAGCFKAQRDVTVSTRWPRSDAPRRWFIARVTSEHELRLRIAPKQAARRTLGNAAPIGLELRLNVAEQDQGATVQVRLVPVVTAALYGYLMFPGIALFLAGWGLLGPAVGIPVAFAVLLAIVWPRRLFEDAKELRNKTSAALGPVLLEEEAAGGGYRSGGRSS